MLEILDAAALLRWRDWSLAALDAVREELNALNIFPVADADTGTNLLLTLSGEITTDHDLATTADLIADAALLSARGSSGAILSQLLRGAADRFAEAKGPVRGRIAAEALSRAAESAYAAVSRPVEGTMLSVARAAAKAAIDRNSDDLHDVVQAAVAGAREALLRTPQQLEVLAKAGVVDAGGRGVVVLLEVMAAVVEDGLPPVFPSWPRSRRTSATTASASGREVMYLLRAPDDAVPSLRTALDTLGEAVVVSGGGGVWNVHVHTEHPDAAIAAGEAVGEVGRLSVTSLLPAPVPVLAQAGDTTIAAARDVVADAGGVVVFPDGTSWPINPETTPTVIAMGAEMASKIRVAYRELIVVQVDSVVQALAALAVHDRHRMDDAASMAAASDATRHSETSASGAPAQLNQLLNGSDEVVTLVAGDNETVNALAAAIRIEHRNLTVDVAVAPDLDDIVLIGVE